MRTRGFSLSRTELINKLRWGCIQSQWYVLTKIHRMDIDPTTLISLKAKLDLTYPRGIHIGYGTSVAFGATILSHDGSRDLFADTWIGKFCFIGSNATIFPGVTIGDHCVIGASAVVTKDIPAHSVVFGNPGRIIRHNIHTKLWGILCDEATQESARTKFLARR